MSEHDGGPAFPGGDGIDDGMSLRDYFAGQALSGFTGTPRVAEDEDLTFEDIAEACYLQADAMLRERDKFMTRSSSRVRWSS